MQKVIKPILLFYSKTFIPTLILSVLVGAIGGFNLSYIGLGFIIFGFFFLTIIYDYKNPEDYYFYNNLGLSKLTLKLSATAINLIIFIILSLI